MTQRERWAEYYAETLEEFSGQAFPVVPSGKAWAVYYHWDKRNEVWQHHDWSELFLKEDKKLTEATSFRGGKLFVLQYLKDKGYIPDFAEGYSFQKFLVYTVPGMLGSIAVRDSLDSKRQTIVFDGMYVQYEDDTGTFPIGPAHPTQSPPCSLERLELKLGVRPQEGGVLRLLGNFKLKGDRQCVYYPKNNVLRLPTVGHIFVEPDLSFEDRKKQLLRERLWEVWQDIRDEVLEANPMLIFDRELLDATIRIKMEELKKEGHLDWEKIRHRKGLSALHGDTRRASDADVGEDGAG